MIKFLSAVVQAKTPAELEAEINESIRHEQQFYPLLTVNAAISCMVNSEGITHTAILIWSFDDSNADKNPE